MAPKVRKRERDGEREKDRSERKRSLAGGLFSSKGGRGEQREKKSARSTPGVKNSKKRLTLRELEKRKRKSRLRMAASPDAAAIAVAGQPGHRSYTLERDYKFEVQGDMTALLLFR